MVSPLSSLLLSLTASVTHALVACWFPRRIICFHAALLASSMARITTSQRCQPRLFLNFASRPLWLPSVVTPLWSFHTRRNLHRRLLSLPATIFIPTTSIFTTYAPPSQPHDNSPQTTNPPRHCSSSNTKTISLTQPPPSSGLIAYSEGTRLTPSRHAAAAAFCERAGKPPPSPYTLVPRPRGFIATVNALRGTPHVRAVLDVTIAYARGREFMRAPPFWETVASGNLRGDEYRFYAHVDRWEMDGLPTGEEELAKWLDERWAEKGKRLERLKTQLENGEEWERDGSVSKKDS